MKCVRCSGLMYSDNDQHGDFIACRLCGNRIDKPVIPVIPLEAKMLERRLHPAEVKAKVPSPETIRWRKRYESDPEGYRRHRRELYAKKGTL